MQPLTFVERLALCSMLERQVTAAGGTWSKYNPAMETALKSNAAPDWQAFLQMIIADLPQILAFITSLMALFGGG